MKKILLVAVAAAALLTTSCVSKKQYAELESENEKAQQEATDAVADMQKCEVEKEALQDQVADLKSDKQRALKQVDDLTVLTQSSSDNIKEVISQLSEKDKYINGIREAMTQKDSINLAIKYQLTKELSDGIQDQDIQVDVEKTVVFISLSDKFLFKAGSYKVSDDSKKVLAKVAKIIQNRPEMEVMVEGHTDSNPVSNPKVKDNWDLSVLRATSVVRVLEEDHGINPQRLVAAGRGEHISVDTNDTAVGRAANRRTKIIIMPKLDDFFKLLEE